VVKSVDSTLAVVKYTSQKHHTILADISSRIGTHAPATRTFSGFLQAMSTRAPSCASLMAVS
jgi:hypothetical protein